MGSLPWRSSHDQGLRSQCARSPSSANIADRTWHGRRKWINTWARCRGARSLPRRTAKKTTWISCADNLTFFLNCISQFLILDLFPLLSPKSWKLPTKVKETAAKVCRRQRVYSCSIFDLFCFLGLVYLDFLCCLPHAFLMLLTWISMISYRNLKNLVAAHMSRSLGTVSL